MGCSSCSYSFFPPASSKWRTQHPNYRIGSTHSTHPATKHRSHRQLPTPQLSQTAFEDRIFLNRMLGLSNLYYIDPEDQDILQELREVRLETIQLMLKVDSMSWVVNSNLILVIVSGPWLKVAYRKKRSTPMKLN